MIYFVKWGTALLLTMALSSCTGIILPNGISFTNFQESQGFIKAKQKDTIETNKQSDTFVLDKHLFNEVKQVNGNQIIQNPSNMLTMVNKNYTLPEEYEPLDLVSPEVAFTFGNADVPKRYLREGAAEALEELFKLAEKDGIILYAVSGFRSYSRQEGIFNLEQKDKGMEKALQAVALPGQSEHQTGLAMDVTSESVNFEITKEFGKTKEGKWIQLNAHKAGFIIRYPEGKESITGYQYEPWHLRYVGKKYAKIIYEKKLTLEEFFLMVQKI